MSTFDGGRRWADHLFGLPNMQWERCVGMPFTIWVSVLFRPLVWILATKVVRMWLVVCTMVRLLWSSYRIALPEKQSSPSFIHQRHASFMAGGPEVRVTVTEIPNQVSCVVFGPFHLTDFKEKCIMLCLEGEKNNTEPPHHLLLWWTEDCKGGNGAWVSLSTLPKVTHISLVLKTMPLIMTHPTSVRTTLFNWQSPREMF